eukprot:scaffold205531_cov21-Tisochrysis_lutea.AAC.1
MSRIHVLMPSLAEHLRLLKHGNMEVRVHRCVVEQTGERDAHNKRGKGKAKTTKWGEGTRVCKLSPLTSKSSTSSNMQ